MLKTGAHQLGKWLRPLILSILALVPVVSFGDTRCPDVPSDLIIEAIVYKGLVHTKQVVVERTVSFRIGEPFSCEKWQRDHAALIDLDLFASIEVEFITGDEPNTLELSFTELAQQILFPTFKSSDINGLMLGGGGSFLNLFGMDIRADAYGRTSIDPLFSATEFQIWMLSPWFLEWPFSWELIITGVNSDNPIKTFVERSFAFELDVYHPIDDSFKLLYTADFYHFLRDDNAEEYRGYRATSPFFLSESGPDSVPKLGFGIVYDTRSPLLNPLRGHYAELRFSQYGGLLGGPASYQEYLFDHRSYASLSSKHIFYWSSLGQYRPGTIGAYDYFHVGGANSLRGFPSSPDFFGKHEFITSFEYRYEFIERGTGEVWGDHFYYSFQWVSGVDMAVLWESDCAPARPLMSFFTGVHILLPILDRVRFEIGAGQDLSYPEETFWAFTVGIFDKAMLQRERLR